MAIKSNTTQPGAQPQTDRPAVLAPLLTGVVVINAFAAIKGEQAIAEAEYDWIPEDPQNGYARHGLSIPPAMEPPANAGTGVAYSRPLAYPADEAPVEDDDQHERSSPLDGGPVRFQSSTGEGGFQRSGGVTAAGEDSGRYRPTEDTPDAAAPTPMVSGDDPPDEPTGSGRNGVLLEGGAGDDTLVGGTDDDVIQGLGGDDTLDGRGGNDSLSGGSDDDRLLGGDGSDHLAGDAGDDQLSGEDGDDSLDGGAGDDRLFGLGDDDRLIGGLGRDELSGGQGADRFVLNDTAESVTENPDRLLDFRAYEQDRIDVSGIDANAQTTGDEAFAFIDNDAFSGTAGELRFTESHGSTYLYGDVNGDGEADFALELLGVSSLSVDDIIL